MAILVAAHDADLVGITTVAGNAPLERTAYNARVLRELLAIDVEVHAGADRPLVGEPHFAPDVHGASGLDGADLPVPRRPLDSHDAAAFIVDCCRRRPGLWLVATGPLTNVATALRIAPDIATALTGISLMGGGSFGNRSAVAEFNIWADPEAAHIVFNAGAPITMAGLDVTHTFQATPERIMHVRAAGGVLATTLADLFEFFSATYLERHVEGAMLGAAVHDPLAVLAVTRPHLFSAGATAGGHRAHGDVHPGDDGDRRTAPAIGAAAERRRAHERRCGRRLRRGGRRCRGVHRDLTDPTLPATRSAKPVGTVSSRCPCRAGGPVKPVFTVSSRCSPCGVGQHAAPSWCPLCAFDHYEASPIQ